ncbi:MAG: hypothetical protein KAI17_09285, partial [Thiotrichaceae bacterium]|nr:hypothetical protein [Thiotrichaceae bacterium]
GARTIDVYGVDGSYDIAKETITLTGTTPAITTTAFLRIFRIKVLTAGSDHVNSGTIIATASVSNTTQAQVEIEQGQTLMALYTVPAGQTAYMHRFYYSINKKTAISANIRLFVKPFGGAWNLKSLLGAGSTGDNSDDRDFKIPMPIAEKTDIRMTAIANVTGGDISAGYDMVLVEN